MARPWLNSDKDLPAEAQSGVGSSFYPTRRQFIASGAVAGVSILAGCEIGEDQQITVENEYDALHNTLLIANKPWRTTAEEDLSAFQDNLVSGLAKLLAKLSRGNAVSAAAEEVKTLAENVSISQTSWYKTNIREGFDTTFYDQDFVAQQIEDKFSSIEGVSWNKDKPYNSLFNILMDGTDDLSNNPTAENWQFTVERAEHLSGLLNRRDLGFIRAFESSISGVSGSGVDLLRLTVVYLRDLANALPKIDRPTD